MDHGFQNSKQASRGREAFFDEADFFTPKSIPLAAATTLGKKIYPKIAGRRYHIVPRREEGLVIGVISQFGYLCGVPHSVVGWLVNQGRDPSRCLSGC